MARYKNKWFKAAAYVGYVEMAFYFAYVLVLFGTSVFGKDMGTLFDWIVLIIVLSLFILYVMLNLIGKHCQKKRDIGMRYENWRNVYDVTTRIK